ncbi:MAG: RDD family protein [Methylotenera sp.]|nr:RDD family protein [Methylotenera sp.]MDO9389214.1 RDD family protein [Methylotenera sp.]MDP2102771.1 RDD family protein [Methylotenera sp.]MDP2282133.1 RDD family protein [Methylotenera sp.]MDP3061515.1 RDD family protein [Methylotenera sp.]
MNNQPIAQLTAPSLLKLGACFIYEVLTVIAISFACVGLFLWLVGDATNAVKHFLLQFFLWSLVGAYFVRCWVTCGQTLAMQAWNIKVVNQKHKTLTLNQALIRYMLATLSLLLCGVGFLWAIFDREQLFLHDRLLRNRIVTVAKSS